MRELRILDNWAIATCRQGIYKTLPCRLAVYRLTFTHFVLHCITYRIYGIVLLSCAILINCRLLALRGRSAAYAGDAPEWLTIGF